MPAFVLGRGSDSPCAGPTSSAIQHCTLLVSRGSLTLQFPMKFCPHLQVTSDATTVILNPFTADPVKALYFAILV